MNEKNSQKPVQKIPLTMSVEMTPQEAAVCLQAINAFSQKRQDPLFQAGNSIFDKIQKGARRQIENEMKQRQAEKSGPGKEKVK
jgi:hypothetical protein